MAVNGAGVLGGVGFVDALAGDCWYLREQGFPQVLRGLGVDVFVRYVGSPSELSAGQQGQALGGLEECCCRDDLSVRCAFQIWG